MTDWDDTVIRRVRDAVESDALLSDDLEIIYCEGAWVCGCEPDSEQWAVPDAEHPLKFGLCLACNAGALVFLWGS